MGDRDHQEREVCWLLALLYPQRPNGASLLRVSVGGGV